MATVKKSQIKKVVTASRAKTNRIAAPKGDKASIKLADSGFQDEMTKYNGGQQKYLTINIADLKLGLRDFKNAVRNSELLAPTIGVVGMWTPVFTSDFKKIGEFGSSSVKGGYVALAVILTLLLLRSVISTLRTRALRLLNRPPKDRMKYETDPDTLAALFCEADELAQKTAKPKKKAKQPPLMAEVIEIIAAVFKRVF